jgi:hypothetical protein
VGDDIDQKKNRQGSGGRRRPQRGPGAEPLVGVVGAPYEVSAFSQILVIFYFLNSVVRSSHRMMNTVTVGKY